MFDVVFYNAAYLPTAAVCWLAAGRVRAERTAWRALTIALLLSATANCLRTLAAGIDGNGPYPPLIDSLAFAAYLLMYVTMLLLIRTRVPRFHPSMWLDGVIGALGTMSARGGLPDRALSGPHGRPRAAAVRRARDARRPTSCSSPCSWPSGRSSASASTAPCCSSRPPC